MKNQFLDLGKQPIANGFLRKQDFKDEFFFDLKVEFDDETYLVSLSEFVPPEKMFNDQYVYYSSLSQTMRSHFRDAANSFKSQFNPKSVLEIGSNDGVFVKHFERDTTIAVEPCGNFAEITNNNGYFTYPEFWDATLAERIHDEKGKQDLIYSANCMCHIQDISEAFSAIKNILSSRGVFIFEDPALSNMINRTSYDQIYDEHAHIFSVLALDKLLQAAGLEIFKVEGLKVHGGSNRIYAKHKENIDISIDISVAENIKHERATGLDKLETFQAFADNVEASKRQLLNVLKSLKSQGKKIVSYGATSKSTTVFNYCQIDTNLIDYIIDTTEDKQNKHSPGVHIPVMSPEDGFNETVDIAFLGAWNYEGEILNKEEQFLRRGGKFITHVPSVRVLEI